LAISEPGTIRPATLADALDIASVHVESWRETYGGMVPPAMLTSLSAEGRAAMWRQILSSSGPAGSANVYVAEVDHRIVGFGACCAQRAPLLKDKGYDCEISALYVLKAFQRRTLGGRLLSAMAADLAGRGFGAVSLWVLRDNTAARRFYERQGAEVVADREETRADGTLFEVAYGWMHLGELASA
jgi:ribosomal protein S18 acetylase RimI-like enzyme